MQSFIWKEQSATERSPCTARCSPLLDTALTSTPSSPAQLPHPRQMQRHQPEPTPWGGSRDPPLMPPLSSDLATHWGNSLCQHHPSLRNPSFMDTGQLCNPRYSPKSWILLQLRSSLLRNSAKPMGRVVTSPVATSPINPFTTGGRQGA